MNAGWTWVEGGRKHHYFIDGLSLCPDWQIDPEIYPELTTRVLISKQCSICRKLLLSRKKACQPKYPLSKRRLEEFKQLFPTTPTYELMAEFGLDKSSFSRLVKRLGLKRAPGYVRSMPNTWEEWEEQYLKEHFRTTSIDLMADHLERSPAGVRTAMIRLDLVRTPEEQELINKSNRGFFPKGHQSNTKIRKGMHISPATQFRKGHVSANKLPLYTVCNRFNHKKGSLYLYIKVAEPNRWQQLHQYVWEQENGPIPRGKIVVFRNNNPMQCTPDNLELITKRENMLRNSFSDRGIAVKLARKDPAMQDELMKQPVLLEVVRLNYQLNREIKNGNSKAA